jgi:cytochrome c peroxidase
MRLKVLSCFSVLALCVVLAACNRTEESTPFKLTPNLPAVSYDYSIASAGGIAIEPGMFGFGLNPANPQITNDGAALGRVLFYDPQLSLNNRISCASCHKQELAFSDGKAASQGFGGKTTPRNAMAIVNPGFNRNLFWDSRSQSVLDLVAKPIQNHIEMGMDDLTHLASKLAKIDYYPPLFQKAFGQSQISEQSITNALSQFVSSMLTMDSKFDRISHLDVETFTELEKTGKDLFFSNRTNCSKCHAGQNFAAPDFPGGAYGDNTFGGGSGGNNLKGGANNGLDLTYKDGGMGNGRFRIPSLRNIALTAPYMHDGRFNTLEEVIEHYNSGIQSNGNLDKNLLNADGSPLRPNLNLLEKRALVAFLNTLTDESFITNPKYSDPFK